MSDIDLKELRKDALLKIDCLNEKLENLTEEKQSLTVHNLKEKLMLLQIEVEEAKIRGSILDEYYRLVSNRDSGLDNNVGYRILYNKMQGEIKTLADDFFQSFSKLKHIYECLEVVSPVSKTGVEYFDEKFNEEYDLNTKLWANVQSLCSQIKSLDEEVDSLTNNSVSCEEYDDYDDYDFIANP